MTKQIEVNDPRTAFILIGPPASGKTTWAQDQFNPQEILSADTYREAFNGPEPLFFPRIDRAAFAMFWMQLEERAKVGGIICVDNTNINGKNRRKVVNALKGHGYEVHFVIFNTPLGVCLERNKDRMIKRDKRVADAVVESMHGKMGGQEFNGWDHIHHISERPVVVRGTEFILEKDHVVFIGDVHGQFEKLMDALRPFGYDAHLEGEKLVLTKMGDAHLVFLGDLVDRGPHSPQVMEYARLLVEGEFASCVMGNHEENVCRILKGQNIQSKNSQETAQQIKYLGWADRAIDFMESMPIALDISVDGQRFLATHAGPVLYAHEKEGTALVPDGFRRWLFLRGVPDGSFNERGMRQITHPIHIADNGLFLGTMIYGHVNQSVKCVSEYQAPFEFGNSICLESGAENEGGEVCVLEVKA